MPASISWKGNIPKKGTVMKFAGTNTEVHWKVSGDDIKVFIPASIAKQYIPALAFSYTVD